MLLLSRFIHNKDVLFTSLSLGVNFGSSHLYCLQLLLFFITILHIISINWQNTWYTNDMIIGTSTFKSISNHQRKLDLPLSSSSCRAWQCIYSQMKWFLENWTVFVANLNDFFNSYLKVHVHCHLLVSQGNPRVVVFE